MRYLYKCEDCHTEPIAVTKSMSESSRIELCKCGKVMTRIYNSVHLKTSDGIKNAN